MTGGSSGAGGSGGRRKWSIRSGRNSGAGNDRGRSALLGQLEDDDLDDLDDELDFRHQHDTTSVLDHSTPLSRVLC